MGYIIFNDIKWTYLLSSEINNNGSINHIVVDHFNVKWFIGDGITAINDTLKISYFPDSWDYVFVDNNNTKWFGNDGERGRYDNEAWTYYKDDKDSFFPYTVGGIDSNMRQYWGGGFFGFRVFDGDISATYTEVNGVPLDVTAVFIDENDIVWLGTGNGLWSYCEGEFEHLVDFNEKNPYDMIYDIEIDTDGAIWFVSWDNQGSGILAKYTPEKPLSVSNNASPTELSLNPATPNPFNAQTTLSFTLPSENMTTLSIYDITGRKVRELVSGTMSAGTHSIVWNGKDGTGETVASGVYLSRLVSGGMVKSGRMAFVK